MILTIRGHLCVRGVFETHALAMIRLNKFPGKLTRVESETRIVSELYIDFIVKHHVNHFRCQSLSTLSMVPLCTCTTYVVSFKFQRVSYNNNCIHACDPCLNFELYHVLDWIYM